MSGRHATLSPATIVARRLLAYAPGHPMIAEALRAVTSTVLTMYREHTWMPVIPMTGPDRFHFHGVAVVLKRNGYPSRHPVLPVICPAHTINNCWDAAALPDTTLMLRTRTRD